MSYAFSRSDKSVQAALRRIAIEQTEFGLARASDSGPLPQRLHDMRLAVKKLRGLIRLVKPAFPDFRNEDAALRDAARHLSPLRDTHVVEITLTELAGDQDASGLLPWEVHPNAADPAGPVAAYVRDITGLRQRASGWRLGAPGFDPVAAGLASTVRLARRRHREARENPDDETLHAWRTRVKNHFYQSRLLEPIWPEVMAPHIEAANRLGDLLGAHHDLAVLAHRLRRLSDPRATQMIDRARNRQVEIWAEADLLGARLFAEKPKALAARWGALWKIWRNA
ncbi:CHAD domain-containing protein [Palleronia sp. KMU-117]|uniref:CHAD domain-containing protein n=1 Tax=Palleronia sp. KMU-117 TaxID=3434108 RepID=UPI003D70E035